MDLREVVSSELWGTVQAKYGASLFADATLEAIKALSALMRHKAAVDGDGATLVGQALGGQSPKIKLNKMTTTSEVDEQKGFEQLLRGLYQGIRNPRTHDSYADGKADADALIHFVDYLYRRIRDSRSYFVLSDFKARVFDKLFVQRDDYAEMIVAEIPYDELVDAAVTVFRERSAGDGPKLDYFFRAVLNRADRGQTEGIVKAMSAELRCSETDDAMISVLRFLPGELWCLVDDDVRLRCETKMIASVSEGRFDIYGGGIKRGHLGTWASDKGEYFKLNRELSSAVIDMLRSNWYTQNYIGECFFHCLHTIVRAEDQVRDCCTNLAYAALSNPPCQLSCRPGWG